MNILEKSQEIGSLIDELVKEKQSLNSKLSAIDKRLSAFDHLFECAKFPAHIRAKLNKQHDACFAKRREIKVQIAQLSMVESSLTKFQAPNKSKIEVAGAYIFTGEGLTKDELEEYQKYILPQFRSWSTAKAEVKSKAKTQK